MVKKRVVCYCRVSTDTREQENSIENQKSYFEREIRRDSNCVFEGIYADEGFTGTRLNNPAFIQMIEDAGLTIQIRKKHQHPLFDLSKREAKFDEIWIKNTSRFARNTWSFDAIECLRRKNVYIRFIEQNINTRDIGSDLLLKLFQLFDEQDSKDKSLKVSTGIREGALKGVVATNSRIFGYWYNQPENKLVINEQEADIIRLIYKLYSEGLGCRRIINHLTAEGLFTRDGMPFCKSTLKRILTNEKYIGLNVRLKYNTGRVFYKESYPKIRPTAEWLNTTQKSEKVPAIVTDDIFYECQRMLKQKTNHEKQKGIYKGITEYAGLIYCAQCGAVYIANKDDGRHFYNCKSKKMGGRKVCSNPNVQLHEIDSVISEERYIYNLIRFKARYILPLSYIWQELSKRSRSENITDCQTLKDELNGLYQKRDKYVELFSDSIITKADLLSKTKDIDARIQVLESMLGDVTKPTKAILQDMVSIDNTIIKLQQLQIKDHYTKEEIIDDIERIDVSPDKRISVTYKINRLIMNIAEKHDIQGIYQRPEFQTLMIDMVQEFRDGELLKNIHR